MPDDQEPAVCPYCDCPFPDENTLTLHKGLEHYECLSPEEIDAFRDAYEDEKSALRSFQIRALAVLVALYFGFLFIYAGVT